MMQLTKINGKYELLLPPHRAARPEWQTGWEVERIEEMIKAIKPTDVVFDVGAEEYDTGGILSKYTGCKMVLFEPNVRVYSCIKAIINYNDLKHPLAFYGGFLSDKTTDCRDNPIDSFWDAPDEFIPDHGFAALSDNRPDILQITLDDWCERTGIYPDVITMDCEGSEQNIIRGAEKVLREKKPIIFMSVHPEFMIKSYRNEGKWKEMYGEEQYVVHMLRFIKELGYKYSCINYDLHELHMRFDPE